MKKVSYILVILCLIPLFSFQQKKTIASEKTRVSENFKILPEPRSTVLLSGEGLVFGQLESIMMINCPERPVMASILNQLPISDSKQPGLLKLEIGVDDSLPESSEAYVLTIRNGNVLIQSRGQAGLFYGCQTLEQLLEDSRQFKETIPACVITDFPEMSYRAVQIDVKHHLDHLNTYYKAIDRLARYKINAVIFEFEDKLKYQRQPLIGAPQAISIDEMAALTKYAKKRNIEISPLVQGLGHASFILKHQQFAHLREQENNRWAFCPMDEGTYQVLFDMYLDAMEATPGSKYLHIGGDEIGNIGLCPRCKPTADEQGTLSLNLYWLNRVSDFVISHGRIPIFWDDMPLKEAGVYETTSKNSKTSEEVDEIWEKGEAKLSSVISELPRSCVFMRWNYSSGKQAGNLKALEYYKKNGLDVMIATAAQSGPATIFPFDERDGTVQARGLSAIESFIELSADRGIDGMLCTAWDDRSPHMETLWRGYIASAQYSWNPGSMDLGKYDQAYLQREYGTSIPDYGELYLWLREAADFWTGAFNLTSNRMDILNALLPLPGIAHFLDPGEAEKIKSLDIDYRNKLIWLPDSENPGKWSLEYADRLQIAKELVKEYPVVSEKLKILYNTSQRNRYHWKVIQALNDFQISAPQLLLALQKCDTKNPEAIHLGMLEVRDVLDAYHKAWEQLKNVYEETRFYSYTSDYVPDRYYHFASQREDLTWMVQVEELFHPAVREWMEK